MRVLAGLKQLLPVDIGLIVLFRSSESLQSLLLQAGLCIGDGILQRVIVKNDISQAFVETAADQGQVGYALMRKLIS